MHLNTRVAKIKKTVRGSILVSKYMLSNNQV